MDGVRLDLALLGNLNLGGIHLTAFHKLAAKSGSLLRGNVKGGGDVCGRSAGMSAEVLKDRSLNGLIGKGCLRGLGRALGVAGVHLENGFGGEGAKLIGESFIGGDGIEEFTVSHNSFLSISGVGHRPIYWWGFPPLTVI